MDAITRSNQPIGPCFTSFLLFCVDTLHSDSIVLCRGDLLVRRGICILREGLDTFFPLSFCFIAGPKTWRFPRQISDYPHFMRHYQWRAYASLDPPGTGNQGYLIVTGRSRMVYAQPLRCPIQVVAVFTLRFITTSFSSSFTSSPASRRSLTCTCISPEFPVFQGNVLKVLERRRSYGAAHLAYLNSPGRSRLRQEGRCMCGPCIIRKGLASEQDVNPEIRHTCC